MSICTKYGRSLTRISMIILIVVLMVTLSCTTESEPTSAGVFLKNPGEQYIPLERYTVSASNISEFDIQDINFGSEVMSRLKPGGKIVFFKEPRDSCAFYMGVDFLSVWVGSREFDTSYQVSKLNDETYVWDYEMLESILCTNVWYILKVDEINKERTFWLFGYDDLSGQYDFLGEWGQADDYQIPSARSMASGGSLVQISMRDCQLHVGTKVLSTCPATFKDGQIEVSYPQTQRIDISDYVLTLDQATGELVAPDGLPFVEGTTFNLKRYIDDMGESVITRMALEEKQRAQQKKKVIK